MIRQSMCAVLALSAMLSVANSALAQMVVTPEVALRFLDANKDGMVTLNDYLNVQMPKMTAGDLDQNGELTYKEFKETLEGRARTNAEQSFRAFNRDGRERTMNQRDFLNYHAYVFTGILDGDKDGFLTADELGKVMSRDR